jgi:hypothetical protein
MTMWQHGREARKARMEAAANLVDCKIVASRDATP